VARYKTQPGISDLKHLQKFVFDAYHPFQITDFGGYFGFAMASPTLQHIAFTSKRVWDDNRPRKIRGTEILISEECESMIRSAFGPYMVISF
jgi:hypothetical protein